MGASVVTGASSAGGAIASRLSSSSIIIISASLPLSTGSSVGLGSSAVGSSVGDGSTASSSESAKDTNSPPSSTGISSAYSVPASAGTVYCSVPARRVLSISCQVPLLS